MSRAAARAMTGRGLSAARIFVKTALKTLLALAGLPAAAIARRRGVRVLFYHRVNPCAFAELDPVSREITVRPEAFERQLAWLRDNGYRSLAPEELVEALAAPGAHPKALAITFDDGYEDNLRIAAPLLRRYGFTAIVFVATDFLGREHFLGLEQLKELRGLGLHVGSHSCSHRLLCSLDDGAVALELGESRRVLEAAAGAPVRLFAYPSGDFDRRIAAACERADYAAAFTTIPGINQSATPRHALRRTEVSASDTQFLFRMKLRGALDWLSFKEAPALRRSIGALNRLQLRMVGRA